jgi:hypothetical protein
MATINGAVQTGGPVNGFFGASLGGRIAFLIESTSAVPNLLKYKMQGWYAAGSVWEVWVVATAPNTFPPSGHTLTEISFVIFEDTASD